MDDITLARTLHILAVVHWIGGVAFVTAVILPAVARLAEPSQRLDLFERIEGRFAMQAKASVLVTGLTGLYMTYRLDAWERFVDPRFWWMHAMVAIWSVFAVVLFVAEPLFLHAWFRRRALADAEGTFRIVQRAHGMLLGISTVTIAGAVLGARGALF